MTQPTHVSGTIKPLEWKPGYCDEGPCFKAEDHGQPGRTYIAFDEGDMKFMREEYEARVAAQIRPVPDAQPVASSEAGELISRDEAIEAIKIGSLGGLRASEKSCLKLIRALPAARAEVSVAEVYPLDVIAAAVRIAKLDAEGVDRWDAGDIDALEAAGLLDKDISEDDDGQDALEIGDTMWTPNAAFQALVSALSGHSAPTEAGE